VEFGLSGDSNAAVFDISPSSISRSCLKSSTSRCNSKISSTTGLNKQLDHHNVYFMGLEWSYHRESAHPSFFCNLTVRRMAKSNQLPVPQVLPVITRPRKKKPQPLHHCLLMNQRSFSNERAMSASMAPFWNKFSLAGIKACISWSSSEPRDLVDHIMVISLISSMSRKFFVHFLTLLFHHEEIRNRPQQVVKTMTPCLCWSDRA